MRTQTFYNEIKSLAVEFAYVKGPFTDGQRKDILEGFELIIDALEEALGEK